MQQNNKNNYYYQPPQQQNGSYYQPPINNNNNNYQQNDSYLKRKSEMKELMKTGIIIGATIVIFLVIQVVAIGVVQAIGLYNLYESSSLFQNCLNIVVVHLLSLVLPFGIMALIMALILKKNFVSPLIPSKKITALKGFMWVCLGMGCCMAANIVTNYIILLFKGFGYELTQSELATVDSPIACIALVFSTAIVPAVCEEFAMRCCALGVLRKYGKGFAVFAVSIVFGLIHGNVIQFVFAFLVGAILGYITVRTDNVVIAMIVHGCNNGLSVVSDITEYAISEKIANLVSSYIYIAWLILGVVGLVYLINKKELLPPKKEKAPKDPYALSFGTKLVCLIPGFFVPFLILIALSITTIVPIS